MGPVNIGELVPLTKNQTCAIISQTYAAFSLVHKTGVHGYEDDSWIGWQIQREFEILEKKWKRSELVYFKSKLVKKQSNKSDGCS